jgi:DNA-binding NtrC family response regulator
MAVGRGDDSLYIPSVSMPQEACARRSIMAPKKAVVLIVEDEPVIRFSTLDALEEVGHTVREAGNADEAMVLFRNHSDIDIVFTDVDMAGSMDGIRLSQRIRAMRPSIGIIITSGVVNLDPMLLPANTVFLPKPYQHDRLLDAIFQLMP